MLIGTGTGVGTRNTTYDYHDLYRLTSETITDATNGNRTTSWSYDPVGNRLSQTIGTDVTTYNSAGTVSDSYLYTAFGEDDVTTGITANDYRYTGEQFDPNVGFYYLRARYYNAAIGRFQTMDTFAGRMHEPQTLHKYLYVHSNPINMVDPSGNVSMTDITAAVNVAGNLTTSAIRIGLTLHRVQNLVDFVLTLKELSDLNLSDVVKDAFRQSSGQMGRIDIDGAINSLIKMSPSVSSLAIGSWFRYVSPRAAQLDRIVVYLPQAPLVAEIPLIKKKNIQINLRVDPKGKDRVTGVGIAFKRQRKVHQLWRMDHHRPHDGRNSARDAHFLVDGKFHYHVRKPPR